MANGRPKISIVLHAARCGDSVEKCLRSLLDQTVPRQLYEIIVIDDASSDNTAQVLRGFGNALTIIRTEEIWGSSKSRNVAVGCARGDIVLFTAVDCVAERSLLEEHLSSHERYQSCAVVGRIGWQDNKNGSPFPEFVKQSGMLVSQSPSDIPDPENVSFRYVFTANMSLPKRVYLSLGMSDERLFPGYYSDIELGYRLQRARVSIIYNNKAAVCHSANLGFAGFSRRMIAVGKAAATLQSIDPAILDFSGPEWQTRSIIGLRLFKEIFYVFGSLLEYLEKRHHSNSLRRLLFEAYRIQLLCCLRLGYLTERKRH